MSNERGDHDRHFSKIELIPIVLLNFCEIRGSRLFPPCFSRIIHSSLLLLATGIEGSDDDALVTGEQDEELSRWEQEQIRKGINIPQVRTKELNFKNEKVNKPFLPVLLE